MTRITDYPLLPTPSGTDILPIVDISDVSQSTSGSLKQTTVAQLLAGASTGGASYCTPSGNHGGSQDSANISAALAATGQAVLATGTYYLSATIGPLATGQWIICSPGVIINWLGTGDCFRWADTSTYTTRTGSGGGLVGRPVIDGTSAGAGSTAIHAGDILQLHFDVAIQNFTGTGSIGAYFDNQNYWAEQAVASIWTNNCTQDVVFNCGGATTSAGSFDRGKFTIYLSHKTFTGDCITWQNGAYMVGGVLEVFGNINSSASAFTHSVFTITGTAPGGHPSGPSLLSGCLLNINLESDEAQAHTFRTINFGSTANTITNCTGSVNFGGGNQFTASNITTLSSQFTFVGPVVGDTTLNETFLTGRFAVPSSASFFSSIYQASIGGSPGTPTGGVYTWVDSTGNLHLNQPGGGSTIIGSSAAGADPTGTSDSTSALNAAAAAAVSAGVPLVLPAGTFKITGTLDWRLPGLKVVTAGAQKTIINMVTANTPILQLAGEGQTVGGLTLRYASQQTSAQTSSIGVELGDDTIGSCFLSRFEDLRVYQSAKGFATNPAITGTASGVFSCYFGNVEVFGYSISAIDINGGNGTGAGNTGCVFDNIYVHNNFSGTPVTSSAWPVIFRNWSELVINELNIEKCIIPSPALQFAEVGNVVINSLHLEGIQAGGTNLGLLGVGTQVGSVVINGWSVRFSTFTGSASNSMVQFTGGSGQSVLVNGFSMPTSDGGNSTPILALADFGSVTSATVAVNGINPLGPLYTALSINAGAGSQVITDGPTDWLNVGTLGADTSGTADASALIQRAINALPASGGTVYLPAGTFKIASTVTAANKQVYIKGAGRWATKVNFTGTGDCFRIYSTTTLAAPVSGGVLDLTIDGTSAGTGSAGLHLGDTRAVELRCAIQNFSGAGSMGMHFDNQYAWTEETHGYLWLSNNTQNLVFDVSAPAATTVAAGSNGGTIANIATWGAGFGGSGVLSVAATTPALTSLYPTSGTLAVAASGSTTAVITYTGLTATSFTGCAYVSGSPSGTVATGGAVGLVTSDNSFGYSDLTVEILAKAGQDGLVCQNGAVLYHSRVNVKANFTASAGANTSAAIRLTGAMPANHPHANGSAIQSSDFSFMAECSNTLGTNAPQTIAFGTLTGSQLNNLTGCVGILDFTFGAQAFQSTNYTSGGAAGAFSFMGLVMGDFNLNPATSGVGQGVSFFLGAPVSYSRSLFNTTNGNLLIDRGDFFQITLAQNTTVNLVGGGSAFGTAQRKTIVVKQPSSGGPYTLAWPSNASPTTANPTVVWANGIVPQATLIASATDEYTLETYDGSIWYGTARPNVSALIDPTGVADSTAGIQALMNAIPATGGTVNLPAGTYKVTSTLTTTTMPTIIKGAGRWATQINFTGTGDCFRMYTTANLSQQQWGGGVLDLTIDGAGAGAGSCGLHIGDNEQIELNLIVQNFAGAGSIGVHLDNQYWWTEKCHGTIVAINNSQGVVFDESGAALTSAGSFGYLDLNCYIYSYGNTPGPAGQDGVVVANGARPYNGRLVIKGNFQGSNTIATTSAVLRVTGQGPASHPNAGVFSAIANCHLDIQVECTSGSNKPFTINFGGSTAQNTILGCYGIMDFTQGGGTFTPCNLATVSHAGTFGFAGMILGDFNLQPANTLQHSGVSGVAMVWGQSFGNSSGFFVNDGDFFSYTLTGNTTISINPGGVACIPAPQRKTIILKQAAAGGPYTVTWPHTGSPTISSPTVSWAGGTAPTMTATASATDVYELVTYDGATWIGSAKQNVS